MKENLAFCTLLVYMKMGTDYTIIAGRPLPSHIIYIVNFYGNPLFLGSEMHVSKLAHIRK